jgi:hypothetical protein
VNALALLLTLLVSSTAADSAAGQRPRYTPCRHEHLTISGGAGGSLPASHLRVIGISCADAAEAVSSGTYEATPAGPLFSTAGFACTSPVGPPPPGAKPRSYRCRSGERKFEFLVPGFS